MTTPITPEMLLSLPDNSTMELVDGQIVEKNASVKSSEIEGLFHGRILLFLLDHAIAKVYPSSLGYQCFKDDPLKIRKPDVTVVRNERLREFSDRDPSYMPIAPDLAVEIISPKDVAYQVDSKVQEYLDAGFPLVWVAHPVDRTVTVHPLGGRPAIFTADDELTAEGVLPGFRCKVANFFPEPTATGNRSDLG